MFFRNAYSRNEYCRYCAMKSVGDVETLIANTAVDIANSKPRVVIGEDTDLLILFIRFVNKKMYRIMFFSCQTKILNVNPKNGGYTLNVNSWGNVYVMGY